MRLISQIAVLGFCGALGLPAAQAQISFFTTVDLAVRNSPEVRGSAAAVKRAEAGVSESVDVYKPHLTVGSSVGYSYGFPVGQPSIYDVSAQSLAFSFSQRDYVRSARAALKAAQLKLKDTEQQTMLTTALSYIELAKVERQTKALGQEDADVGKLISIEEKRVAAGVDSKVALTKAKLSGAQVALKRIQLENRAAELRAQLAHLTGLQAVDMTPDPKSIPAAPTVQQESGSEANSMNNSSVQAAYATAKSKLYTAFGDARQNNRPTIAFGLEYNRYAKFNNYSDYYLRFQHNNFNAGIQIQIPLFDPSRKAKAQASGAEAAEAEAQADQLRDQISDQTLQLKKSLGELAAQERVAALQSELAQDQLDAVTTELQSGSGNPLQPALTPKDEEQARINERARYVDMLDAKFQLTEAQLNLMRSLGRLGAWVKSAPLAAGPASP